MKSLLVKMASVDPSFRRELILKLAQGYLPKGSKEAEKLKYKPLTRPGSIWKVTDSSGPSDITKYRARNPNGKAKTFRDYMEAKKWSGKK